MMDREAKIQWLHERLWDATAAKDAAQGMAANIYWQSEMARFHRELNALFEVKK
jgi:hypothetical protein